MSWRMPGNTGRSGLCTLLVLLCCGTVQAQTTPAHNQDVRLPGIHTRWARPEDPPKPETTIEALEQCMGQDQVLRQRLPALQARQTELEAQRLDITNGQNAIQRSHASLEAARKALTDSTTAHERSQQDMNRRRNELTPLGSKPAANPAEAKRVQDLIQRFNADLRGLEPRRQALLAQQKEFNQQVAVYNAQVNALNERAAPWDARWQAFVQDMKALNDTAASHNLQCAGERALAKPDTPPDVRSPP
jgi:chromosome segregation ATPase